MKSLQNKLLQLQTLLQDPNKEPKNIIEEAQDIVKQIQQLITEPSSNNIKEVDPAVLLKNRSQYVSDFQQINCASTQIISYNQNEYAPSINLFSNIDFLWLSHHFPNQVIGNICYTDEYDDMAGCNLGLMSWSTNNPHLDQLIECLTAKNIRYWEEGIASYFGNTGPLDGSYLNIKNISLTDTSHNPFVHPLYVLFESYQPTDPDHWYAIWMRFCSRDETVREQGAQLLCTLAEKERSLYDHLRKINPNQYKSLTEDVWIEVYHTFLPGVRYRNNTQHRLIGPALCIALEGSNPENDIFVSELRSTIEDRSIQITHTVWKRLDAERIKATFTEPVTFCKNAQHYVDSFWFDDQIYNEAKQDGHWPPFDKASAVYAEGFFNIQGLSIAELSMTSDWRGDTVLMDDTGIMIELDKLSLIPGIHIEELTLHKISSAFNDFLKDISVHTLKINCSIDKTEISSLWEIIQSVTSLQTIHVENISLWDNWDDEIDYTPILLPRLHSMFPQTTIIGDEALLGSTTLCITMGDDNDWGRSGTVWWNSTDSFGPEIQFSSLEELNHILGDTSLNIQLDASLCILDDDLLSFTKNTLTPYRSNIHDLFIELHLWEYDIDSNDNNLCTEELADWLQTLPNLKKITLNITSVDAEQEALVTEINTHFKNLFPTLINPQTTTESDSTPDSDS